MLLLAKTNYERLECENYAGEIVINSLKDKNRELIKRIAQSSGHLSTNCSSFTEEDINETLSSRKKFR